VILAIDPGTTESAYVIWDGKNIIAFDKIKNRELLSLPLPKEVNQVVIEMVASYGMAVGKDVFETVFWIGRIFQETIHKGISVERMYRKDVKMNICESTRAKDANIVTALVDRFGDRKKHGKYGKGVKKDHGFFFGFSKDIWQAFALAVTWYDQKKL
jgi:hypothetical protein